MRSYRLGVLVSLFFGYGCTCSTSHQEMSAGEVVESYLYLALNMESIEQKQDLLRLTTGPLRAAIAGSSDATIKAAYLDLRYQLKSFAVLKRQDLTPRETRITYQLAYYELSDPENLSAAVELVTQNVVVVVREDGRWRIKDVLGSATSFDFPVAKAMKITPRSQL